MHDRSRSDAARSGSPLSRATAASIGSQVRRIAGPRPSSAYSRGCARVVGSACEVAEHRGEPPKVGGHRCFGGDVVHALVEEPPASSRGGIRGRRTEVQGGGDVPDARGSPPAGALVFRERALGELQPLCMLGERAASGPAGEHVRAAQRAGVVESFGDADRVRCNGEQLVWCGRPATASIAVPFETCARSDSGVRDVLGGGSAARPPPAVPSCSAPSRPRTAARRAAGSAPAGVPLRVPGVARRSRRPHDARRRGRRRRGVHLPPRRACAPRGLSPGAAPPRARDGSRRSRLQLPAPRKGRRRPRAAG